MGYAGGKVAFGPVWCVSNTPLFVDCIMVFLLVPLLRVVVLRCGGRGRAWRQGVPFLRHCYPFQSLPTGRNRTVHVCHRQVTLSVVYCASASCLAPCTASSCDRMCMRIVYSFWCSYVYFICTNLSMYVYFARTCFNLTSLIFIVSV